MSFYCKQQTPRILKRNSHMPVKTDFLSFRILVLINLTSCVYAQNNSTLYEKMHKLVLTC